MVTTLTHKIALIGDPKVGKTSLRTQYMGMGYSTSYLPTLGVDFSVKKFEKEIDGKPKSIVLQIWDLAGQKNFSDIRKTYLAGVSILLLVYDITNPRSFNNLLNWLRESFAVITPADVALVLIGNKIDLIDQNTISDRQVSGLMTQIYQNFPKLENIQHIQTSAKSGYNISEAFEKALEDLSTGNRYQIA